MNFGAIGRTRMLYDTVLKLCEAGHCLKFIITSRAAPESDITQNDFKELAEKYSVPFLFTQSLNTKITQLFLNDISDIEIVVSVNFSSIIKTEFINRFPSGILNAHAGDLPRYRGNAPLAWAIINRESRIGLCIHKMIGNEVDSGNIIGRRYYDIDISTKIGTLQKRINRDIPELMLESVTRLGEDPNFVIEIQSKDPADALRGYPRIPADGKINWSESNENILRLINASSEPYAGAFTCFNNEKLIIWEAELYKDDEKYLAAPGQISEKNDHVIVITGQGKLIIKKITYKDFTGDPTVIITSIRTRFTNN